MADYFLKSGSGVTAYAKNTAYSLGDRVVAARADIGTNSNVAKRYVWECTTAGTTDATNYPTWDASYTPDSSTETSGTATFTCRNPGYSSGSTVNWTFAHIYMDMVVGRLAAGDRLFVSNNHAESNAVLSGGTFAGTFASPNQILCVNDSVTSGFSLTTGASVTTTSNIRINITGSFYCYGLVFNCGTGTSGTSIELAVSIASIQVYENCDFILVDTHTATAISVGSSTSGVETTVIWNNCRVKFAAAGQGITLNEGRIEWQGGSIISGGTSPTALLEIGTEAGSVLITNLDLTNASAGINLCGTAMVHGGNIIFRNCKMPTSWSGNVGTVTAPHCRIIATNCDAAAADTNYRLWVQTYAGSIKSDTSVYNDAGADDGSALGFSWVMAASANAEYPTIILESPEIVKWQDTTGSSVTATVEIVHNSQGSGTDGVLNDDEIWIELDYLGTSTQTLGTRITNAKANVLASAAAQATSTATWTGDSAGWDTQKLSVTFTPQEKGYLVARVCLAKASATVYVDPLITVS